MKNLLLLPLFIIFTNSALAQNSISLIGDWQGHINIQGQQLIIKTHFSGDDSLRGTIDIPQQGASGLPLQKIHLTNRDSIFFEFQAGPGLAKFKGAFQSNSIITGTFHQRGLQFPFELERYEPEVDTTRKATPAPKPYHHKDLIIKNDSIAIGGTLTWPKGEQANKLVIMISGSGAQDRDETLTPISDFKPFALLADSLTEAGIATFRYDDRGVGQSTGNFGNATLDILANDVHAIIQYFTHQSTQTFDQLILLGHSQGGVVGGKVSAGNKDVDKLILMASTGVSFKQALRSQIMSGVEKSGIPKKVVEREVDARERLMETIRNDGPLQKVKADYKEKFRVMQIAAGADSSEAQTLAERQANSLVRIYGSPQMQSLLFYDPTKDINQLSIPVLALFGEKDTQVFLDLNKPPIENALNEANIPHKVVVFDEANHPFQKAKTGRVQEYSSLDNQFVDGFLSTIVKWIKKDY